MNKALAHLHTINKHKLKVTWLCFRCHLYKQGLLHDLSKYSYIELKTGFHYYQGFRSPIDAEKEEKGYSLGWLHHKGRNKHHWEYWLDFGVDGIYACKMPTNYVIEMFCDRVAASMIYQKEKYTDSSALEYYENGRGKILNKDSGLTYSLITVFPCIRPLLFTISHFFKAFVNGIIYIITEIKE